MQPRERFSQDTLFGVIKHKCTNQLMIRWHLHVISSAPSLLTMDAFIGCFTKGALCVTEKKIIIIKINNNKRKNNNINSQATEDWLSPISHNGKVKKFECHPMQIIRCKDSGMTWRLRYTESVVYVQVDRDRQNKFTVVLERVPELSYLGYLVRGR